MNAASINPMTTICSACKHGNLPDARFCASCGAPLAQAPAATPAAATANPSAGQRSDAASAAVLRIGGEVLQQLTANQVSYRARYRSIGSKFNAPLYYSGLLAVGDTPASTTATAKIEPKSLALQLAALAVAITVLMLLPMSIVGNGSVAFVALAATASSLWMCLAYYPKRIRTDLLAAVAAESPAATTATPSAAPASEASASAPAVAAAQAADPLTDSLRRLAELRSLGALTEAEYAAKKAELLARL